MFEDHVFSKDDWTIERLVHVFNSERSVNLRGTRKDYLLLRKRMLSGSLICNELTLHCKPRPQAGQRGVPQSSEFKLFKHCSRGGSHLHGWLKWWAYHWLLQESTIAPKLEQTIPNYGRADLHLSENCTVVECGNTSPGHAMRYLDEHPAGRFIVVPFQRAALENMGPYCIRPLLALEFITSKDEGNDV